MGLHPLLKSDWACLTVISVLLVIIEIGGTWCPVGSDLLNSSPISSLMLGHSENETDEGECKQAGHFTRWDRKIKIKYKNHQTKIPTSFWWPVSFQRLLFHTDMQRAFPEFRATITSQACSEQAESPPYPLLSFQQLFLSCWKI